MLRIGFLNVMDDVKKLQSYMEVFDMVICDDGSLCPVLHLLNQFLHHRDMQMPEHVKSGVVGIEELDKILGAL